MYKWGKSSAVLGMPGRAAADEPRLSWKCLRRRAITLFALLESSNLARGAGVSVMRGLATTRQ